VVVGVSAVLMVSEWARPLTILRAIEEISVATSSGAFCRAFTGETDVRPCLRFLIGH
jgi:hypothetical protein